MPCYDPRPEQDYQTAVRVACELAKKIRQIDIEDGLTIYTWFSELSEETKHWIIEHEAWDRLPSQVSKTNPISEDTPALRKAYRNGELPKRK